jgi:hypothetical protein
MTYAQRAISGALILAHVSAMVPMFALMNKNTSTQNVVNAFAVQITAYKIKFGTKQFVPVFAAQQSALIISTGMT